MGECWREQRRRDPREGSIPAPFLGFPKRISTLFQDTKISESEIAQAELKVKPEPVPFPCFLPGTHVCVSFVYFNFYNYVASCVSL